MDLIFHGKAAAGQAPAAWGWSKGGGEEKRGGRGWDEVGGKREEGAGGQ